jgi:hypothetical protein
VTVQKVCFLTWDDDEVRRTLDCVWSDLEGAGVLEELKKGNEDLYRFKKIIEAQ